MSASLQTTGCRELDELFEKLKQGQKRGVFMAAFRHASKPVVAKAKSNFLSSHRRGRGHIVKALGTRPVNRQVALRVGARVDKKWRGYHAHLLDQGTDTRYTKKGAFRGRIKGSGFFTKAVESTAPTVEKDVVNAFKNSLIGMVARANNKAKSKK